MGVRVSKRTRLKTFPSESQNPSAAQSLRAPTPPHPLGASARRDPGSTRRRKKRIQASATHQAHPGWYLKATQPSRPAEPLPLRARCVPASAARSQNIVCTASFNHWDEDNHGPGRPARADRPRPKLRDHAPARPRPPPPGNAFQHFLLWSARLSGCPLEEKTIGGGQAAALLSRS